ncbi:hypothetical protein B0T16DRAFT_131883 [Cercophora newfieldiana]|uniref:BZIP domain-containing protein n=1 Tax=Cercophora newfieldiana TaxID=92897 RepID=A0AA40CUH5_9PEZI|nr:hypothetical protein B0T16DRAFT_131883 [Cercophora newfieldiana]
MPPGTRLRRAYRRGLTCISPPAKCEVIPKLDITKLVNFFPPLPPPISHHPLTTSPHHHVTDQLTPLSQIKTDSSVQQNRESQRRSRARRRELVEDLQRRVAEYERRDARATEAMQVAARSVVEENRRLRALLGSDMRAERTDDSGVGGCEDVPGCCGNATLEAGKALSSEGEGNMARQDQPADKCNGFGKEGCCADEDVDRGSSLGKETATSTTHETSCEEAVAILRELQKGRHIDSEQVRTALGCSSAETCLVKNTRLFQVMDELS